jgi:hypothetical protein
MLVHFHIPKTAGTSTKRVIESWYQLHRVEQGRRINHLRGGVDDEICVTSHFASAIFGEEGSLTDSLPELVGDPSYKVFTLLRDPLDHLVSSYYHHRTKSDKQLPQDIVSFAEFPNRFIYRNSMCASSAEDRSNILKSFYFIGDTSDIDGSMKYLAQLLGKRPIDVPKENVGDRDELILQLTSRERSRIERALAPEYELFETVRDMIRERSFTGSADARADQFEFTRDKERQILAPQLPSAEEGEEENLQTSIREREAAFNEIISSKSARIEELETREAYLVGQLKRERDQKNAALLEAKAFSHLLTVERKQRSAERRMFGRVFSTKDVQKWRLIRLRNKVARVTAPVRHAARRVVRIFR